MPALEDLTRPDLIFADLQGAHARGVLREIAEKMAERKLVDDPDELYRNLMEREELGSTGIGDGVAIPHCKIEGLSEVVVAIGVAPGGVDFGAVDDKPVRIFFVVVSPAKAPAAHLQCLASISRWIKSDRHLDRILAAEDPSEIYDLIQKKAS